MSTVTMICVTSRLAPRVFAARRSATTPALARTLHRVRVRGRGRVGAERAISSTAESTSSDIGTSSVPEASKPATVVGRTDRLFKGIDIELRAHQPAVLKSYVWFATTVAKELDVPVVLSEGEEEPHKLRKTLLKAAFVNSKHRVQYEMRTYFWTLNLGRVTESTKDTYLEYIQRNLPEGVAMKVTTHEMRRLPEAIREHMAATGSEA